MSHSIEYFQLSHAFLSLFQVPEMTVVKSKVIRVLCCISDLGCSGSLIAIVNPGWIISFGGIIGMRIENITIRKGYLSN